VSYYPGQGGARSCSLNGMIVCSVSGQGDGSAARVPSGNLPAPSKTSIGPPLPFSAGAPAQAPECYNPRALREFALRLRRANLPNDLNSWVRLLSVAGLCNNWASPCFVLNPKNEGVGCSCRFLSKRLTINVGIQALRGPKEKD